MQSPSTRPQIVRAGVAVIVVVQLGFRAWALVGSWFYTDDYRLLRDARLAHGLSLSYLLNAFDSQFMPGGRLIAWLVWHSGVTNWNLAVVITLLLQLAATLTCAWMCVVLFGPRPGVLALVALYAFSVMTMPSLMWWAASLNHLPQQVAFFGAVGAGARYLRTRSLTWLGASLLFTAFGLAFYVKTILVALVLAFLCIATFGDGSFKTRLRSVVTSYWPAILIGGSATAGFAAYYAIAIPQPFVNDENPARIGEVANAMLGTSLPVGLLGGPWRWWKTSPPLVLASPPDWTVHLAWVVLALAVAYSILSRKRVWPGWALLGLYAVALYVLLLTSRGQEYGAFAGWEYRYLSDMACAAPLALGLVFLGVPGAPGSSHSRVTPLLAWKPPVWLVLCLGVLVVLGGLYSSTRYVMYWHHDNAGKDYVANIQADMATIPAVALPAQTVPENVMPAYTWPSNQTPEFLPLVSRKAHFPKIANDLDIIDPEGHVVRASLAAEAGARARNGRQCLRPLRDGYGAVHLDRPVGAGSHWLRMGYLSARSTPIRLSVGTASVAGELRSGLHELFVKFEGPADGVRVDVASRRLCTDRIDVGRPVALEELP